MSDTPDTPALTIHASNTVALIALAGRYMGAVGTGFMALLGFLHHRDVRALTDWLQGEALLPFVTALVSLSLMGMGALATVRAKALALIAGRTEPRKVIVT